MAEHEIEVITGSYGTKNEESIQILRYNLDAKTLRFIEGIRGVDSPSYVIVDSLNKRLFSVSENAECGEVVSFRKNEETQHWTETSRKSTQGQSPCYLAMDVSKRWLLGVNYSSSSTFVFPISSDGTIGEMTTFVEYSGEGVHPARQERSHPHSIINIPNSDFWIVCDLGTDQLHVYLLNSTNGTLQEQSVFSMSDGAGPRHVAFHPVLPVMYVSEELSSAVSAITYDVQTGELTGLQTSLSTLPTTAEIGGEDVPFVSQNTVADIHVSETGDFVYVSNRGHDSLAVFLTCADGSLEWRTNVSTMGRTPRNFVFVPATGDILVANQDSNSIAIFRCGQDGVPRWTGTNFENNKPVCIQIQNLQNSFD